MSTGFVYIAQREESTTGRSKIGSTTDLDRRRKEFNRETGADCEMVMCRAFSVPFGKEAIIERTAHRLAAAHKYRQEWFDLDIDTCTHFIMLACRSYNVPFLPCWDNEEAERAAREIQKTKTMAAYNAFKLTPATYDSVALARIDGEERFKVMRDLTAQTDTTIRAKMLKANQAWGYCVGAITPFAYALATEHQRNVPSVMYVFVALVGWAIARALRGMQTEKEIEKSVALQQPSVESRLASESAARLAAAKSQALALWQKREQELRAACLAAIRGKETVLID